MQSTHAECNASVAHSNSITCEHYFINVHTSHHTVIQLIHSDLRLYEGVQNTHHTHYTHCLHVVRYCPSQCISDQDRHYDNEALDHAHA